MDKTMSALAATNKFKLVATIFFFACLMIYKFSLHPLWGFVTAAILTIIVTEDKECRTIDLRLMFALGLWSLLWSSNKFQFVAFALGGFFVFDSLRLATARFFNATRQNEVCGYCSKIPVAYVPILLTSICLYLFTDMLFTPNFEETELYKGYEIIGGNMTMPITAIILLVLAAINFLFSKRIEKAEQNGKEVAYGFGDGDPYMLAWILAVFGIFDFTVIYFVSVVLVLACYGRNYLFEKGRCV